MRLPTAPRRLPLVTILCLAVNGASAEATRAPTPPPLKATAKPYAPSEGQAGKDVAWVPTPEVLVERMLDMACVTPRDFVIDLGSGDGRVVIAAAKRGARALGIEYNADMVELSKHNARVAAVEDRATFIEADIFESDLSKATVITMFLLPLLNMELRPKLLELAPGTRIVSNTFPMEDWQADDSITLTDDCAKWCCTVQSWIVPAKVGGTWRLPQGMLTLEQRFQMLTGRLGFLPISKGRLRGNRISFEAGKAVYTGHVNGRSMHGTVAGALGTSFSARRVGK